MLFPVLQLVLLWWTVCLMECHGAFFGIGCLLVSSRIARLMAVVIPGLVVRMTACVVGAAGVGERVAGQDEQDSDKEYFRFH